MSDKPRTKIEIILGGHKIAEIFGELPPPDSREFICKRDHGDIGHDVLEIVMPDGTSGQFCLRCIVNLLSSCCALPKEPTSEGE